MDGRSLAEGPAVLFLQQSAAQALQAPVPRRSLWVISHGERAHQPKRMPN